MQLRSTWNACRCSFTEHRNSIATTLGVGLIVVLVGSGVQQAFLSGDSSLDTKNIARRLHARLQHHSLPMSSIADLEAVVQERQRLLRTNMMAHFSNADGLSRSVEVSPRKEPQWILPSFASGALRYELDRARLRTMLSEQIASELRPPEDATIVLLTHDGNVLRATGSGVAKSGDVFDVDAATSIVMQAVQNGEQEITVPIERRAGQIFNATGTELGTLTLLAGGQSNFRGSTWSRIQNVRKALHEHVNNVIVPPGGLFSFNATLGGPVTTSRGWYMALVIVNGTELVSAPGGGICQASTTVFRALVNAGFEPVERRAHSLYVSYYEQYGVGIDATVFPGSQDLTFVNDTGNNLLVQAYTDGFDAMVNIYGTPDGRTVELAGPYFASTAPAEFRYDGRPLYSNEIAWVQDVTYADGRMNEYIIHSRYNWVPKQLVQKYAPVHASAE